MKNLYTSTPSLKVLIASGTLATALVLSACTSLQQATPDTSASTVATAADRTHGAKWQKKEFSSFYGQKIDWGKCTAQDAGLGAEDEEALKQAGVDFANFECATVKAPLNWANPDDDRSIELAISRTKPAGDSQDSVPLFTNPGGPGIAGIQHTMLMGSDPSFEKVLSNHELWGFDPRGIGNSTPVHCDSSSTVAAVQLAECASSQPIAQFMGTSQVARDMELLRVLAGDKQLDYVGYSYGTMLGATYATLFPDHAGRMVLDSAENAGWGMLTHNFDQAVAISKAVGDLANRCGELTTSDGSAVECPFTSEKEMLKLKKRLTEKPLKAPNGKSIDGEGLRSYLTSALYVPQQMQGDQLDLLGRALKGDEEALNELAVVVEEGNVEIDAAGQLTVCPSTPKTPDLEGLIKHMKEVGVPEFVGGPEITDEVLAEYTEFDCAVLPSTGTDILDSFNAEGVKTPLMVIGITGDHATPFQHAQELAKQLGQARLVTLEGSGHGASFSGRSTCIDQVATDYLVNGTLPEEGKVCQAG